MCSMIEHALDIRALAEEIGKLANTETSQALAGILIESSVDEIALLLLQSQNTIFNSVRNDDAMHVDLVLLPDAVSTVNSLLLDEGVPERIENDDL